MSKYIFEISWEVANKVGGIYTVLASKAKFLKDFYGRNYFVIGPFIEGKSEIDFKILPLPAEFKSISEELKNKQINLYYGEWLIEGFPNGFLLDFKKGLEEINSIKYDLWHNFGIDSLKTGNDYNEPVAWSKSVAEFIKLISQDSKFQNSIFHFHEWLSGAALLLNSFIKQKKVFTTHATVLGRTIAGAGIDFWPEISTIDPLKTAYQFNVEAKHLIEKNSAKFCDILTTVSNITSVEVECFLSRKVDKILPNGIDLDKFPTFEEISMAHQKNKESILKLILYMFSPYSEKACPTRNSLIFFISGRKEIKNKGFDVTIKSLGYLNQLLKTKSLDINIYTFIFVPDKIIDVNHDLLDNLTTYKGLEDYLSEIQDEIHSRLLHTLIHHKELDANKLIDKNELLEIQKILNKIKKENTPPVSTHILPKENEFLSLIEQANLKNQPEDKVKIILYPIYLSSTDGFLNLNYYEAINGSHLGIFPSFYEPWGYTPLETLAAGVMAITTDLTGFSSYIQENELLSKEAPGLFIVQRKNKSEHEVINDLVKKLFKIATMSRSERIQNKYEARRLASHFDWKDLIKKYLEVYEG